MTLNERDRFRLDVTHAGLLMLSDEDKRFPKEILETMKVEVLSNNFSFDIILKEWVFRDNGNSLRVKLAVNPKETQFDYYAVVLQDELEKCRIYLYNGKCSVFYFTDFFNKGTWKSTNEFVISGNTKQVDMHLLINECKVKFVNLTPYEKPPLFEMMRAGDVSEEVDEDWLSSLPPDVAAIIRRADS